MKLERATNTRRFLRALAIVASCLSSPLASHAADQPSVVAIEHATVLPMTEDGGAITDATVIIRDGRIASVGPAGAAQVPARAKRVNARGKWLMPALVDMHVHVGNERMMRMLLGIRDLPPGTIDPADLFIPYVANGVLQVVNMSAQSEAFGPRDAVESGKLLGPHMVLAAMIDGSPPLWPMGRSAATPSDGRQLVRDVKAEGYDLVKVYGNLDIDTFTAVIDEARKQKMRVLGHLPALGKAPPERVLIPGYDMIAHAEEIAHASPAMSDADIARYVELARRNGTALTATLLLDERILEQTLDPRSLQRLTGYPYVHPVELPLWLDMNMYASRNSPERIERLRRTVDFNRRLVKAFSSAGILILPGTDSSISGVVGGFALHEELEAMVAAGMTNEQVLNAATRQSMEWLGVADDRGTVQPGKRADLLLLDADPLADISNTRKIAAVIAGKRYLPRAELDRMLADLAARYAAMPRFKGVRLPARPAPPTAAPVAESH